MTRSRPFLRSIPPDVKVDSGSLGPWSPWGGRRTVGSGPLCPWWASGGRVGTWGSHRDLRHPSDGKDRTRNHHIFGNAYPSAGHSSRRERYTSTVFVFDLFFPHRVWGPQLFSGLLICLRTVCSVRVQMFPDGADS